ncbi:MAG TPA: restriction endonuclease [Sulfuricurvum sp.]|nr:restriction endonuclease [Sulfuricurvum sp.]
MSSPIDEIFEQIFGHAPKKSGTAFEQIAAIASHFISEGEVIHDDKIRGEFSKTLYQIDIHHKTNNSSFMGEVKDYTLRNGKVGRGDLQKLAGALPDLKNIDAGTFFSATGYTKPAKKYAEEAENIIGKPITLFGLRPSSEVDEQGYIKTIVITIDIVIPQVQTAKWVPLITDEGKEVLKVLIPEGDEKFQHQVGLHCFYDSKGNEILSLHDLTSLGYGVIHEETGKSHGSFLLAGHYMKVNGILAEMHGLEYELEYSHHIQKMEITDDSEHRFVLLDKDDNVMKFLTDEKLREFTFDENGKLTKK